MRQSGRRSEKIYRLSCLNNSDGMALVLTLVLLAIITAMVVEFTYGVYTNTNSLHNWQTAQRLSLIAESGLKIASDIIKNNADLPYTYPRTVEIDESPVSDFQGDIYIKIEDENSKFNIKTLVYPNGKLNEKAYNSFISLLNALGIDAELADRIVDWMDPDNEPMISDSEQGSKNKYLDSVDELLLLAGMDKEQYEAIKPYVTIYSNGLININTAEIPVLMSLSEEIDIELAQRIVEYRKIMPFEKTQDIFKVAGFEGIGTSLMGSITVKGTAFSIVSLAEEGGIKRVIEAVVDASGNQRTIIYWKEI